MLLQSSTRFLYPRNLRGRPHIVAHARMRARVALVSVVEPARDSVGPSNSRQVARSRLFRPAGGKKLLPPMGAPLAPDRSYLRAWIGQAFTCRRRSSAGSIRVLLDETAEKTCRSSNGPTICAEHEHVGDCKTRDRCVEDSAS
jgi:hypothetical protein